MIYHYETVSKPGWI